MTAFSRAERTVNNIEIRVEARSYNSRYLDLVLRIPQSYNALEEKIKALVSEKVTRGRIEIKLHIKDDSQEACAFEVNEAKAVAYHHALLHLKEMFGFDTNISLGFLTGVSGIIKPAETDTDAEKHWQEIRDCLTDALDELGAMRKKEGDFIAGDFTARLAYISESINEIEKKAGDLLFHYQERLKERIEALTRGITEIDPSRIAQEAAFLADRSDISEEILRARSHIRQFRLIMDSEEAPGRKLNFLLQEFNREFNTMGSKSGNADVSHIIIALKSELEKIREQVQNIE